jgi:hypothetical protein
MRIKVCNNNVIYFACVMCADHVCAKPTVYSEQQVKNLAYGGLPRRAAAFILIRKSHPQTASVTVEHETMTTLARDHNMRWYSVQAILV